MSELRRVAIVVPRERAEEARAAFVDLFPRGFEEAERGDEIELAAYVDDDGVERLRTHYEFVSSSRVEPGWEDTWRSFHHGIGIGRFWVGPPWETPPVGLEPVVIDPGRAFGTGAHATTRLCVELLQQLEPGSLLDVGCGSGVLSIVAAKLGFAPVVALDLDDAAVEATLENARVNGAEVDARLSDALTEQLPRADVTVANIALAPVQALAVRISSPWLITSGYFEADLPALDGMRHVRRRTRDGWAADLYERV